METTETEKLTPTIAIGELPVKCSYAEMVDPKTLVPHPLNPNKHPPKQIEMFLAILQFQGWRRPITVSKLSGFITKGHGALETALHYGITSVPVDYQDYGSEMEEQADLVADNQLAKMSEMDSTKLMPILVNLDSGAFNMELTGFENQKLEKLMTAAADRPAPSFTGAEGAPVAGAGAPAEGPIGEQVGTLAGGPEGVAPHAHVRMVQLFFNENTVAEFMQIVEFFQNEIKTNNVTDTVLEVLRSAFRAHTGEQNESGSVEPQPEIANTQTN